MKGIVVKNVFTLVMPLVQLAKKIMLVSNASPLIREDIIERQLTRHGKIDVSMQYNQILCDNE